MYSVAYFCRLTLPYPARAAATYGFSSRLEKSRRVLPHTTGQESYHEVAHLLPYTKKEAHDESTAKP